MRYRSACIALLVALSLAGCKQPSLPTPPAPAATGYGNTPPPQTASAPMPGGNAQRFLTDLDVPGQWWTLFHSKDLNALVDQALAANPDVSAAQAAITSAQESFFAQRSSIYPIVVGSASISRVQTPTFFAPPLTNPTPYIYYLSSIGLNVGYTPDVFGNLHYQTAAAKAVEEIARYQAEATYLTLTSNVAGAFIQASNLNNQIATTKRIIAVETELLRNMQNQRQYGQVSGLDVANQEALLAQTEQTLPALEQGLEQTRHLLARLTGTSPDQSPVVVSYDLNSLHLPEELPLSLPSKLIDQRPDIGAATASLAQASAQVGVAYTNRLPNFSITADLATQALQARDLFNAGSFFAQLVAELTAPLYDQGVLKHRESAAIADYNLAAAQYKGTVLTALENVADSVIALQSDAKTLAAAKHTADATERALSLVRAQQQNGQVAGAAVLQAQQSYEQSAIALGQAQASRYADTVALFEALGGGWWNRNDTHL